MDYTKEDLKVFKHRDIKPEQIDRQLANFEKGFDYVDLSEPATIVMELSGSRLKMKNV